MRAPVVLGVLGVALGVFSLAISRESLGFSFVGTSIAGTTVMLVAGWSAMICGLGHWTQRSGNRLGLLLFCAGGAWFLSEWDTPSADSTLVFSLGLLLYGACPAFVAHVTLGYPTGRLDSATKRLVVLTGYATAIGLFGLLPALFFDPSEHGCTGCPGNLLLVSGRIDLHSRFTEFGVIAGLAWAVLALVAVGWEVVRASGARRRLIGWVALAGSAYLLAVASSYAAGLERGVVGTTQLDRSLWVAQAAALTAVAAAVAAGLQRSRRTQRTLARLVVDLDRAGPAGGMRDALADLLGDPDLVVAYRMGDERYVDAAARPVVLATGAGRASTTVDLAGGAAAVLVHRAGLLDSPDLIEQLGSAAHLGLENERLQAEALTQLVDLRASRARLVEAGDEERRRLERDLHDGAQQRLVGLALALRLLRSRLERDAAPVLEAEAELRRAIGDLRDLARGLFPVVLRDEGLAAALGALAETSCLRVLAAPPDRFPHTSETTAYLVVARVADAGPATVTARTTGDTLVVDLDVQRKLDELDDLDDRVRALGGDLLVSQSPSGATHVQLVVSTAPTPDRASMPTEPTRDAQQTDHR